MTLNELIAHSIDKDMKAFFLLDTELGGAFRLTLNTEKNGDIGLGLFDSREAAEAFREHLMKIDEEIFKTLSVESMTLSAYIREFENDD